MKKRKEKKKRSPYWRTLRILSNQIIPAKKGRGSYRRKKKHKHKENYYE